MEWDGEEGSYSLVDQKKVIDEDVTPMAMEGDHIKVKLSRNKIYSGIVLKKGTFIYNG